MGIEKFATFINTNYPSCKQRELPKNISSLFIDCNGIFHKAKERVYLTEMDFKSGTFKASEEKRKKLKETANYALLEKRHIKEIINSFEEVLRTFSPSDNLFLAPDGCANAAKMQQQKSRRYNKGVDPHQIFDHTAISPGTDFMFKLDEAITKWVHRFEALPPNTIYSSHMDPGEGEHKIFQFIREGKVENPKGNHIVYGADGDLFMLSLLSPLENIYLVKENLKQIYDINKLKSQIYEKIKFKGSTRDRVIQDFALLTFFIGNDFLPKMPNMASSNDSMILLQELYQKFGKYLSNENNEIIWNNFLKFLKTWREYKNEYNYDIYTERAVSDSPEFPYPELMECLVTYDFDGSVIDNPEIGKLRDYKHQFNLKKFSQLWYDKQFRPKNPDLIKMFPDKKYFAKKDIINMVYLFLKTYQWVLKYYTQGFRKISDLHFYPFFYAPMLDSVISYLAYLVKSQELDKVSDVYQKEEVNFTAIHQLLLILSPASIDLIPVEFRDIYTEKLGSISPVDFQVSDRTEGTSEGNKRVKFIPPINPFLVNILLQDVTIPEKYHQKDPIYIKGKNKKDFGVKALDFTIKNKQLI